MRTLEEIAESIKKIEQESVNIDGLEDKIRARLLELRRETLLTELKEAEEAVETSALLRKVPKAYLWIFAESTEDKLMLGALQKYKFTYISEDQINLGMFGVTEIDKKIETEIRLTYYYTFWDRFEKLCKAIQSGELDDYTNLSASQLIYETMGNSGKLLPIIDKPKIS
jgi:hypothetical protein